jgi:hypothetical protein
MDASTVANYACWQGNTPLARVSDHTHERGGASLLQQDKGVESVDQVASVSEDREIECAIEVESRRVALTSVGSC